MFVSIVIYMYGVSIQDQFHGLVNFYQVGVKFWSSLDYHAFMLEP